MADHGLGHGADGVGEYVESPAASDPDLLVPGPELPGDQIGIFELVPGMPADALEADGKRPDVLMAHLGQQGDDQRAVQSSRQQDAYRYVGNQPPFDRRAHRLLDGVAPVPLAHWRIV